MADGTDTTGTQGNGTTGAAGDWTASLPETIRGNEVFKGFQDVGGLAQAYLDASGNVRMAPEDPEGYIFEGVKADDPDLKDFREAVHKEGLDAKQAQGLLSFLLSRNQASREAQEAAATAEREKLDKSLKADWKGSAFDENMIVSKRAMSLWAGPMVDVLAKAGIADHPAVLKAFHAIGRAMGESKAPDSVNNGGRNELQRTNSGTPVFADYDYMARA